MRVRALDSTGDWMFGKGQNDYKQDLDAFAQELQTRVSSWVSDCFFSQGDFVDWKNLLGSKNQAAVVLAVSTTIMNTPGFLSLVNASADLDSDRRLTITYSVISIYGPVAGTINPPGQVGG